jgi:spermidine/putrescine transport system substrate-binding protein
MRNELNAVLRNPMSRRKFMQAAMVTGSAGILAACRKSTGPSAASSSGSSSSPRPSIDQEPGTLHAYEWAGFEVKAIWKDYAAKGYPAPKFSFYTNTEQALAKTAAGYTWDTAHPEVGYVQDYYNLGAIQPWDTSLIGNFPNLNPVLEKAGQLDGVQYEIVTDWGYSGVIIRTDKVDPSINSYSYLFDDDLAGHISWFDTPWVLQQAAMVQGVPGQDTFDMTDQQLQDAKNYCIEKKKNLYNIWVDFTAMWDDVIKGNVWAAYAWPDAWLNTKDKAPTQYIKPKEGVLSWGEGLILNANTENYYHAHEFAQAWTMPATGLWIINNYAYGHSNLKVDLSQVPPDVVKVFGLDDPEKWLSEPYSHIDRFQPNRDAYNRAWDEVKAA